jgi:lambda repressor-like predicted transcriptional regulator
LAANSSRTISRTRCSSIRYTSYQDFLVNHHRRIKAGPSGRGKEGCGIFFFFFFDQDFSERLAAAMEDRGLDANALSMIAGVTPSTVQRWLTGKFKPRYASLKRIADTLDVSCDYLLGRT